MGKMNVKVIGGTVPLVPLLAVATVPFGLATAGLWISTA